MSEFTSRLKLNYLNGKDWEVADSFTYRVGSPTSTCVIVVPAGTITDFASIPKPLRLILPTRWKFNKASVLHDYLYRHGDKSKAFADAVFLEAMLAEGLLKFGAYSMAWAVSVFGGLAYDAGVHYEEKSIGEIMNSTAVVKPE